jgi:pyruvate,water dikinase
VQKDTVFSTKKKFGKPLDDILNLLDTKEYVNLFEIGDKARALILSAAIPDEIRTEILLTNSKQTK